MSFQQIIFESTSEVPKRYRHTMVRYKDNLYVFGGTDEASKHSDIFEFNIETKIWRKVNVLKKISPSARSGHSACVYGNKMIMFGGFDSTSTSCNDIYSFNFDNFEWKKLDVRILKLKFRIQVMFQDEGITILLSFIKIHFLSLEDMVRLTQLTLGWNGNTNVFFNDIYSYNLESEKWKKIEIKGDLPSARFDHTSIIYQDSMYVFGGENGNYLNDVCEYNFLKNEWKEIETTGEKPSKRSGHKVAFYSGRFMNESSMFLFGGYDGDYCNDLYNFNFSTRLWKKINYQGVVPTRRYDHGMAPIDNGFVLYGGYVKNGKSHLNNDLFEFKIEIEPISLVSLLGEEYNNLSDFVIKCKDKKIHVNKCILAQSPYFSNYFKENKGNTMDITNVEIEFLDSIIQYFYSKTDKLIKNGDYVKNVNFLRKIHLYSLENSYLSLFSQIINVKNFFDYFTSSYQLKHPILQKLCINFFNRNKEMFSKEDILKLDKELIFELLNKTYDDNVEVKEKETSIIDHLRYLFTSKDYSDVLIVTKDHKELKAHKAILCVFSDYFSLMFKNEYKESEQKKLIFKEFDSKTLNFILEYIYTKDILNLENENDLMDLIRFSDYIMMKDLEQILVTKLLEMINEKNLLNIYQFSLERESLDSRIKEKCLNFLQGMEKNQLIQIIIDQQNLLFHKK